MIFELWYYKAKLPNSGGTKRRPVLVIGDDGDNGLSIVDIHYCIVSASSQKGVFDVQIDEETAKKLGLLKESIIKTTKIYTGSRHMLERKISDLSDPLKKEFCKKYKDYQEKIIQKLDLNNIEDSGAEPESDLFNLCSL